MAIEKALYDELLSLRETIVDTHETCNGVGYLVGEDGYDTTCSCMILYRYLKELMHASIPREYWSLYWKTLLVKDTYKSILKKYFQYFDNATAHGLGLFFVGTNGVGKTAMACEIGKFAIVKGQAVKYFTAQQYMSAQMEDTTNLLGMINIAQVLILDEIEKAYMKEGSTYVPKTIEALLRESLSANKIVIMASNYTEAELEEVFGESTMSLLRRKLKMIAVTGEDLSDALQKDWTTKLTSEYDYRDKVIVKFAQAKWKFDQQYGD